MTLIHKGGKNRCAKNYRPITIVDIEYKLLMTIIRERLQKWAEEGEVVGELQGGFRKDRMTEDNLFIINHLL